MRYRVLFCLAFVGCGSSAPNPFAPVPECKGVETTPLVGDRQMVVSSLDIADFSEGFDLDGDGKIDNKLALLGPLANPSLKPQFQTQFEVAIGIELYGYTGGDTTCTKTAFFLGSINKDRDLDKKTTTWDKGDCLDTDANVSPSKKEDLTNRLDDDCDGFADNMTKGSKPADTDDMDGDGYTLAMGDCDDRADATNLTLAKTRHPGAVDTCGDGIDQDCDGLADNDKTCFPFGANKVTMDISDLSFLNANPQSPLITFKDGTVKQGLLQAGPDPFSIKVPFLSDLDLELKLSGTRIKMILSDDGTSAHAENGLLGGVIDAVTLGQVTGIDGEGIITPDQTLLDALFAGQLASVLGLDTDQDSHYVPDMDVDRDGLEAFWEEGGNTKKVNACKDGNGEVVRNDFDGKGTPCWLATDKKGKYRFTDGISIALKFKTVPVKFGAVVQGL